LIQFNTYRNGGTSLSKDEQGRNCNDNIKSYRSQFNSLSDKKNFDALKST